MRIFWPVAGAAFGAAGTATTGMVTRSMALLRGFGETFVDPLVASAQRRGQQVLVRHQGLLALEPVGSLLLHGLHGGLARGRVRVVGVVLGAITAPARRQLHALHVERFVAERRQRIAFLP